MAKNILVTAATSIEINPFLKALGKAKLSETDHNIDVIISGIGLTACTYHIAHQLRLKSYDIVIQAGVAGCFDRKVDLGTVLLVKQDTIADQSVIELNSLKTLFELDLVLHNQKPYKEGWLVNPNKSLIKLTDLKAINGISVNEITTSPEKINFYKDHFNPVIESMEGAALHYVCLMEPVPFLQIRSISNYIGERNRAKWNMKNSIMNLNNKLTEIIQTI